MPQHDDTTQPQPIQPRLQVSLPDMSDEELRREGAAFLALTSVLAPIGRPNIAREVVLPDGTTAWLHTFTPSDELPPYAERADALRQAFNLDDDAIRDLLGDPPADGDGDEE